MTQAGTLRSLTSQSLELARSAARWSLADERAFWRRIAGWALTLAIAAGIVVQLHAIGWDEVWQARPESPWFYVLTLAAYLVLPLADVVIFRRLWGIGIRASLGAFLRKRVLNSAFIGYSGEIFLLVWARRRVAASDARLAHEIKDSNVLSAAVSTFVTAALILYAVFGGAWGQLHSASFEAGAALTLVLAALMPVLLVFRRKFLVIDLRTAATVLALHALRFGAVEALTLAQWHVAMPGTGWSILIDLLTLQLLVSRIPLVPNRDMLFVGVAIALCGPLSLAPARLASLLIVGNALQLMLHLAVMVLTASSEGMKRAAPTP
jgi:hypothetical protein